MTGIYIFVGLTFSSDLPTGRFSFMDVPESHMFLVFSGSPFNFCFFVSNFQKFYLIMLVNSCFQYFLSYRNLNSNQRKIEGVLPVHRSPLALLQEHFSSEQELISFTPIKKSCPTN